MKKILKCITFLCKTKEFGETAEFQISIFLTRNMYIHNIPLKFKGIKTIRHLISLSTICYTFNSMYKFYAIKQRRL